MAASDTALQASVRASYTAFERVMSDWQRQIVAWRCGLSPELRKRYGAPANWNCRDIKLIVSRVAFEQLGPERARALNAVDTRLKLPADQVDAVIAARPRRAARQSDIPRLPQGHGWPRRAAGALRARGVDPGGRAAGRSRFLLRGGAVVFNSPMVPARPAPSRAS